GSCGHDGIIWVGSWRLAVGSNRSVNCQRPTANYLLITPSKIIKNASCCFASVFWMTAMVSPIRKRWCSSSAECDEVTTICRGADDGGHGAAAQGLPDERGVGGLGMERRLDCERRLQVEQRHVAGRALLQRAAAELEDSRRSAGHQIDQPRQVDHFPAHQPLV